MLDIDLTNIDTQRIGRVGELVVELELLARGWLVGNFNATTVNSAGWDLFATKGGRSVRIRVKAKRPGTSCFVCSSATLQGTRMSAFHPQRTGSTRPRVRR